MKILVVVTDTDLGGVTTSVYNFTNELIKRGNEVTFLDFSAKEKNKNINPQVEQIFLTGISKYWKLGAQDLKRVGGFKKVLLSLLGVIKKLTNKTSLWNSLIFKKLKEEYDVAIAFRQCSPCYSFVLNKVKANKRIGFIHGELKFMGDISSWKKYMVSFDKIAYVSNATKKGFEEEYPHLKENSCVIHNLLDHNKILSLAEEKSEILFDKSVFNIVTVARITKQKQIDWIVKACKQIKSVCGNRFHWYVVGNGYLLDEMRQMTVDLSVDDVLSFVGEMDNPYPLIKAADITALTSIWESFGLVVIESFILKKPIVVTYYEALKEIMPDEKYGIIVPQNIGVLATAVIKMINDEDSIFTNCKENLKSYEYSSDYIYEQFLDAIK